MNQFKLIVAAAILVALVIGFYHMVARCEQPSKMEVVFTQLACAQEMDVEAFRAKACQRLHGTAECQFEEVDRTAVMEMFRVHVNNCAIDKLKNNSKCVDKYEAI